MANKGRRARVTGGGIVGGTGLRQARRMGKAMKASVARSRVRTELPKLAGYGERRGKVRTPFGVLTTRLRAPGAKRRVW